MATAESVLKPDFRGASASTSSSTTSTKSCASRSATSSIEEPTPHAAEWEETTFPDSVFRRMGELDLLGLDKPAQYGGQAATTSERSCWARR